MTLKLKIINEDNWLEVDPTSAILMKVNTADGTFGFMSGEDWVSAFSGFELTEDVPETVRELFEVARGSLAYGYFFYPLCTLACEQLLRVAEAAAEEKCKLIKAPKKKTNRFKDKIQYLSDEGFISHQDFILWDSFRGLRNNSSHPERQSKFSLGMIVPILEEVSSEINKLFSK